MFWKIVSFFCLYFVVCFLELYFFNLLYRIELTNFIFRKFRFIKLNSVIVFCLLSFKILLLYLFVYFVKIRICFLIRFRFRIFRVALNTFVLTGPATTFRAWVLRSCVILFLNIKSWKTNFRRQKKRFFVYENKRNCNLRK